MHTGFWSENVNGRDDLEDPIVKREDIGFREVGSEVVDRIQMTQDRVQWCGSVYAENKIHEKKNSSTDGIVKNQLSDSRSFRKNLEADLVIVRYGLDSLRSKHRRYHVTERYLWQIPAMNFNLSTINAWLRDGAEFRSCSLHILVVVHPTMTDAVLFLCQFLAYCHRPINVCADSKVKFYEN